MDLLTCMILGAAVALGLAWLWSRKMGFLAQDPADYAAAPGPEFNLREHLAGAIQCEGMIYGPTGRVTSRFYADMDVDWDGNTGVMKERFYYDSGAVQDREWTLVLGNDGSIKATAPDVIGEGHGTQSGPAVQLNYRIQLPAENGGHVLDTVDWMYLVENGTIMNRSQFRKFGIKVAELVATMRPANEAKRAA